MGPVSLGDEANHRGPFFGVLWRQCGLFLTINCGPTDTDLAGPFVNARPVITLFKCIPPRSNAGRALRAIFGWLSAIAILIVVSGRAGGACDDPYRLGCTGT